MTKTYIIIDTNTNQLTQTNDLNYATAWYISNKSHCVIYGMNANGEFIPYTINKLYMDYEDTIERLTNELTIATEMFEKLKEKM